MKTAAQTTARVRPGCGAWPARDGTGRPDATGPALAEAVVVAVDALDAVVVVDDVDMISSQVGQCLLRYEREATHVV
jgi:hypothetical protein